MSFIKRFYKKLFIEFVILQEKKKRRLKIKRLFYDPSCIFGLQENNVQSILKNYFLKTEF